MPETDQQQAADQQQGNPPAGDQQQPQTFTQADVDRIVADRLKREREATKTKFGDYDDLKAKAGQSATLEERVAQIEQQAREAESRALRAEVANAKGLTPTQAKRLIGATREELEADADLLLSDLGAQKKNGNRVPREGDNPRPPDDPMRAFARSVFQRSET